jgi:hypothetical protein
LLISGNLKLKGLQLTGAIKSTAKHEHMKYDNSFIYDVEFDKEGNIKQVLGTSLEAVNIRALRGAVSANYMMNEGAIYQHGAIIFSEKVEYPTDPSGKTDYLAIPQFHASGRMQIKPNYEKERIRIMGAYIDKEGLHNLAKDEMQKIVEAVKEELKK